jgi:hypothetical protein
MTSQQSEHPEQPEDPPQDKPVRRRTGLPPIIMRTTKRLRFTRPSDHPGDQPEA